MYLLEKLRVFFPGKHIKCSNNMKYCPVYVHLKKKKKKEEEGGTVGHFSVMIFVPKPSIFTAGND